MTEEKKSRFAPPAEIEKYEEVTIFAPKGCGLAAMDNWTSEVQPDGSVVVPRYAVERLVESHGFSIERQDFRIAEDKAKAESEASAAGKKK